LVNIKLNIDYKKFISLKKKGLFIHGYEQKVTTCIYGITYSDPNIPFNPPAVKTCSTIDPTTTGYGDDTCGVSI